MMCCPAGYCACPKQAFAAGRFIDNVSEAVLYIILKRNAGKCAELLQTQTAANI